MWNIIRIIVYVGLVGIGGRYWYQNPNRYATIINNKKTQAVTNISGVVTTGTSNTTGQQGSGNSIIEQIAQQLSGTSNTHTGGNPFGETYITISERPDTQTPTAPVSDTSTCTSPRGKQVVGGDYTLAFQSSQSVNNICVIEKRICTQGVLGGSYVQHTCYFTQPGGYYEYLGVTGSDSSQLIRDAEIKLGIYNNSSKLVAYTDDTVGVPNYQIIEGSYNPKGNISSPTTNTNISTTDKNLAKAYNLGPIVARTPETKISAAREQQINPNGNGVQGSTKNSGNRPRISYTTDNTKLESTGPANVSKSCTSPRGTQVFNNQHVLAFEQSSVPQGQLCKSEYRTCTQGYLRGSYTKQTCTIEGVNNTNTNNPYYPSRGYYSNGNYYDYDYYDYQGNYNERRYDDWYYERYNYNYRSPRKAYQNCTADHYGFVGHGSTLTMYNKSEVGPGEVCQSIIRTCNDGTLNGSDSYRYGSCKSVNKVNKNANTKPTSTNQNTTKVSNTNTTNYNNGCYDIRFGYINHGASVKMYKQSSVAYNQTCDYEYRTCNNGTLLGSYLNENCTIRGRNNDGYYNGINVYRYEDKYNDNYYIRPYEYDNYYRTNSYNYYKAQGNSCIIPNYGILEDGKSLMMYAESNPKAGYSCDGTMRTCVNGVLSGPNNFNARSCSTIKNNTLIVNNSACYDYSSDRYICQTQYYGTKSDACGKLRICLRK